MPAFLPLNFADNAAPVTPVPNGMSPLTAGYQLAGLANQIKASLPPELKGSDHSIPNIGAYIEYLRADILHNRAGSSYVRCWHGVLAMVGLSRKSQRSAQFQRALGFGKRLMSLILGPS